MSSKQDLTEPSTGQRIINTIMEEIIRKLSDQVAKNLVDKFSFFLVEQAKVHGLVFCPPLTDSGVQKTNQQTLEVATTQE